MKKKIVTLSLVVALVATAAIGGTLAYFTDTKEATNTFTVGNVKIELTEDAWENGGKEEAKEAYPGEPLAKDPVVTNKGVNPCFVRISVSNLDQFGTAANEMIQLRTDYVLGKLGDEWVDGGDGYYYYTAILEEGQSTDALFDHIVMPTALENTDVAKDIVVTAQAVQAQGANGLNWSGVQGIVDNTVELAKWFTTCGF